MNSTLVMVVALALLLGTVFLMSDKNQVLTDEQAEIETDETTQTVEDTDTTTQSPVTQGRTLDLSGKGLTKVPDSVFSRTDIEVLDLSNNNLEGALQAEVRHLKNLHTLDLSDNNFTGVPAEVGQLAKLETLDLSNNPLTGLPYEIGNLKNLKILDLRGTNYAVQDLEIIRQGLPSSVLIKVD